MKEELVGVDAAQDTAPKRTARPSRLATTQTRFGMLPMGGRRNLRTRQRIKRLPSKGKLKPKPPFGGALM